MDQLSIYIPTPTSSPYSTAPHPPHAKNLDEMTVNWPVADSVSVSVADAVEWPQFVIPSVIPLPPAHRELSQTMMTRELNHALTITFYERMGDASQYPVGCRILLETRNVIMIKPENSYTSHELMVNQGGQWYRDTVRVSLDDPSIHWDAIFQM